MGYKNVSSRARMIDVYRGEHAKRAALLGQLTECAMERLLAKCGDESLYAVALYTNGEAQFQYVMLSANTEEGLERAIRRSVRASSRDGAALRDRLRWNPADWDYHAFDKLSRVRFPLLLRSSAEDEAIYGIFVDVLRALDARGRFGKARADGRTALNVVCGDMGSKFFLKGLRALNRAPIVKRVSAEWKRGGIT